ncbi:protein FAM170A-like [Dasypus novemcinctus]|uniref:protein FAM170A-like n=1 Tax=Dasypus novemcinctus TaxID=9361 RepID=UPI00265E037B|nr:protein FAM170A-like [Dasypus novemcinctus]
MKQKRKRKHLEIIDSQETVKTSRRKLNFKYALQCRRKGMTTTQRKKAQETSSSSSEYFSCISSEDKLIGAGTTNLCKYIPQSGYHLEETTLVCEEKDTSSVSEYFSCDSSLHMLSCAGFSKLVEEIPQSGPSGLFQDHSHVTEKDSSSEYFSCASSADKLIHTEFWNFQEDVSKPGSFVVVSAWTQTAEENNSGSEYFSCANSAGKITLDDKEGINQLHQDGHSLGSYDMPRLQDSERGETSSPFPHVSFPFHSVCKTCMYSAHVTKKERVMKIYYMCVQMNRGVAVLWDAEEGVEPPRKKTRMEEITCPEKIQVGVIHSSVPTRELLTDSESSLEVEVQEEREEADRAEPPVLEENSRAKTPDWLVALDSGFRCMGCCRVFSSLEVLQEHVEHGINEGFSCQAFHLALAWLKSKRSRKGKKRRRRKKIKKMTSGSHQEKYFGMRTSSCK